jgi:hypothetical protein
LIGRTLRGAGALGIVAVGLSACAAACGGGSLSRGAVSDAKLEFSRCMRSHGVPNFSDPSANPGNGGGRSSSIYGIAVPSGIDLRSPAFQAALHSCKGLLSGGASPPPLTERQKQAALATARCIRTHGFPTWPDPTFSNTQILSLTDDVDVRSPAFKKVAAVCATP